MKSDRAKIFAPFSTLRGLDEAYRQKEKVIIPRAILEKDREQEIDLKLRSIRKGSYVEVVYYTEDGYKKIKGNVGNISEKNHTLTLSIPIDFGDIYNIDICTRKK